MQTQQQLLFNRVCFPMIIQVLSLLVSVEANFAWVLHLLCDVDQP